LALFGKQVGELSSHKGSEKINNSMNYFMHYDRLIERAKTRSLKGYSENHHIIPRCLGGTDDKCNLVRLTPEEHYVAHQLLVKMYPTEFNLVYAANMMTVESSKFQNRSKNKRYSWLKKRYRKVCAARIGEKNPSYGTMWISDPSNNVSIKVQYTSTIPDGWVKGRNVRYRICIICEKYHLKQTGKRCESCNSIDIRSKRDPKQEKSYHKKPRRTKIKLDINCSNCTSLFQSSNKKKTLCNSCVSKNNDSAKKGIIDDTGQIFESVTAAAEFHSVSLNTVRNRVKKELYRYFKN